MSGGLRRYPDAAPERLGKNRSRSYIAAMIYLLAIFCSPLALLLAGKPISALFNLILYILSIVCWVTIIFFHAGFVLWGLAFLHAVMAISDAREDRRARRIMRSMQR
jgi:uncharacterized membrane protein